MMIKKGTPEPSKGRPILTRGERIFIVRKRKGYTAEVMAKVWGINTKLLREWEYGRVADEYVPVSLDVGDLTLAEECLIIRRREGWTQKQVASKIGVQPLQVKRWESGDQNVFRLATFYATLLLFPIERNF